MLLTKSMRRKLIFAFILVLVPFALFTGISLRSVSSYKRMIGDLELSIRNMPRRDELISAISGLIQPLSVNFPKDDAPQAVRESSAKIQHRRFAQVFDAVREKVERFENNYRKLPETLSHSGAEKMAYTTMFLSVEQGLNLIERDITALQNHERRAAAVHEILQYTADMIEVIQTVPDPSNRLAEKVRAAQLEYRFYQRILLVSAVVSIIALIALLWWGYQFIFVPIQHLHRGVRHVAAGEYGYKMQVGSRCELAHVAQAFNDMTAKIEQDQQDKEREIEQRSKQLILSERLLGAGFLASGVAHEINNPLNIITNAAYGVTLDIEPLLEHADDELREEIRMGLKMIQDETDRCGTIISKLLEFSHGKPGVRDSYDVTAIANEVADIVSHMGRFSNHKVTVNTTAPLRAYVCGPEVKQVILNLVANGLDATGDGGEVSLTLNEYPEQVEVIVADNGSGMTQEQMENIFEPFFTTKEVGKGTGLGLSISHQIVRNHGGTLEVHSDGPGHGSRFTLRLPKTAVSAKAA